MGEHLGMLDVLLDAANISTFMDRLYYQRRIYEQDKQLVKAYFARTKELQSKKEQLAWQKERLNSNIRAIQGYQKQLKESVLLDKLLVDKLKSSQRAYEAAEAQLQQESYRIQLQIQRSTKGIQGPVAGSTGQFMMPVNGPMTSNFGYRVHPVYRSRRFHSGQDFGVRRGTPIKAADGGTVIHAGWQGGYGKTVIINHGNIHGANLTTLYAHMSSISVHQGQSVSRGQIVGLVGSTGLSTGPHLHFEVRQNGKPVNPRNYLR
ncbi:MAG: peptidoglycan DD-metalloendopeptidase family protein [Cyanobacteria bacterium HKST-UBA04]|nr:peptidoglycan DD-metalloendopeptidase family protein [Cyanobacteria bacterium HKST-UBA04]MCA9841822.1 peptidoglycan DD-metalloendopeptidase family protein [Cyanobacteria bacterium HKST-UBA03]